MSTNDTIIEPQAWIGCLACYNEGVLNGHWYDAITAADVTPEDLHHGRQTSHEELWVMDHEGIPYRGEMDPWTATQWAKVLGEVDDADRDALCAWVENGDYATESAASDLPDLAVFRDAYQGHHDSFSDYARQLAEGTGMLTSVPEQFKRYFDWTAWTRDLSFDYTEVVATNGVYIFRN